MRSFKWMLVVMVVMLVFVFAYSVVAASKEETKSPGPAGAAQTAGDEKGAKEKDEKPPAPQATGAAPGVKAPAPPVKILKDEGC
jgi:hypothetical protein